MPDDFLDIVASVDRFEYNPLATRTAPRA